uniref:hypothetical protein n=1 Tax=Lactococcus garvieae TaxID=1363 RepID=UPI00359C348E
MENTLKIITRNEVQALDTNNVYGYILSDGEFILNLPQTGVDLETDDRFIYGDFDAFKFEHNLENLKYIVLKDKSKVSGVSTFKVEGKLIETQEDEPQETVKSIIEEMQELTFAPCEILDNDVQVFSDLLTDKLERLIKVLGLNDVSLSAESKNQPQELALKAQVQALYSLNDSMITADSNHIPKYTDGTIIKTADLADMNVLALDNIAELIGFELEEGATASDKQDNQGL